MQGEAVELRRLVAKLAEGGKMADGVQVSDVMRMCDV